MKRMLTGESWELFKFIANITLSGFYIQLSINIFIHLHSLRMNSVFFWTFQVRITYIVYNRLNESSGTMYMSFLFLWILIFRGCSANTKTDNSEVSSLNLIGNCV